MFLASSILPAAIWVRMASMESCVELGFDFRACCRSAVASGNWSLRR